MDRFLKVASGQAGTSPGVFQGCVRPAQIHHLLREVGQLSAFTSSITKLTYLFKQVSTNCLDVKFCRQELEGEFLQYDYLQYFSAIYVQYLIIIFHVLLRFFLHLQTGGVQPVFFKPYSWFPIFALSHGLFNYSFF